MNDQNNILNQLKHTGKPSVPADFFENFQYNILEKIEGNEPPFLKDLHKSKLPEVPSNYFNSVLASKPKNNFLLDEMVKTEKPYLPENYFDHNANQLLTKVQNKKNTKTQVIRLKWIIAASSIAAAFLIIFNMVNIEGVKLNEEVVKQGNIETSDDSSELLLSYMDEYDLVEFLLDENTEESITLDEVVEYYNYSTTDLTDIYLDY